MELALLEVPDHSVASTLWVEEVEDAASGVAVEIAFDGSRQAAAEVVIAGARPAADGPDGARDEHAGRRTFER